MIVINTRHGLRFLPEHDGLLAVGPLFINRARVEGKQTLLDKHAYITEHRIPEPMRVGKGGAVYTLGLSHDRVFNSFEIAYFGRWYVMVRSSDNSSIMIQIPSFNIEGELTPETKAAIASVIYD